MFKEAIGKLISRVNGEFNRYSRYKSSILLITDCPKDWTQKENQKKNVFLQEALKLCDDKYVELKLDFDQEDEEEDYKVFKQKQRENQIKNFLLKIESFCSLASLKVPTIHAAQEPTSKRAKIDHGLMLGHFLSQAGIELNAFEKELIDMTIWRDHMRNRRAELAIARAWFIARKFILKDSEFTKSRFNTEQIIYENIYAGDEQSMKTPVQLVIQYFLTLAFSTIGVMVVRNNGGKDHIDKCKNYVFSAVVNGIEYKGRLNEVIKNIMEAEYASEWDGLFLDQKNMFDIEIYDMYAKKKLAQVDKDYGKLIKAFMLVGLYNKAFLDKLEDVLMPNANGLFKKTAGSNCLYRYGLIIDEEDELLVSSDRDMRSRDEKNGKKVPRGIFLFFLFKILLIWINTHILFLQILAFKPF
jgi:hypothetical protein